jgi:hypothetical protein
MGRRVGPEEIEKRRKEKEAAKRKKSSAKKLFGWWELPSDRFAGLVAIFTGLLAVVGGLQYCTLQTQLTEMYVDERPWLVISDVTVSKIEKLPNGNTVRITFSYIMQNVGKSPATRVRPRYATLDSVISKELANKAVELETGLRADLSYKEGTVVSPGQQKKLEKMDVEMTISERGIKEARLLPALFISILYDAPGFDEPRISTEVFLLHTGEPGKIGLTTESFPPGVWFKDLTVPLEFVRLTPASSLSKAT